MRTRGSDSSGSDENMTITMTSEIELSHEPASVYLPKGDSWYQEDIREHRAEKSTGRCRHPSRVGQLTSKPTCCNITRVICCTVFMSHIMHSLALWQAIHQGDFSCRTLHSTIPSLFCFLFSMRVPVSAGFNPILTIPVWLVDRDIERELLNQYKTYT